MSVYVDDMMAGFGRMLMCHLIADTRAELLAMVDAIGVQRRWIQKPDTDGEHFDIAKGKRDQAIAAGAIPITWMELSRMVVNRRERMGADLLAGVARAEVIRALREGGYPLVRQPKDEA